MTDMMALIVVGEFESFRIQAMENTVFARQVDVIGDKMYSYSDLLRVIRPLKKYDRLFLI